MPLPTATTSSRQMVVVSVSVLTDSRETLSTVVTWGSAARDALARAMAAAAARRGRGLI